MKALKIEFAPPRRVSPGLLYGLALALTVLAGQQGWEAWQLQQQNRVIEAEILSLTAQLEQAQREAQARVKPPPPYLADALAVARLAAFPVNCVFTALEATRVEGVRLTVLDIAADEGKVKVELEFSDHEALLRYLEQLNAGEAKQRWMLQQARSAQAPGGQGAASIYSAWTPGDC